MEVLVVYKSNIPQSTDFISQSQIDIKNNHETIHRIYSKDHIDLKNVDPAQQGKHNKTTLINQSSDPTVSTNDFALYTKSSGGRSELFYRREGDASGIQLTNNKGYLQNTLVLRAFVIFDSQGNIIERQERVSGGKVVKVKLAYNVSSVTPNQALIDGRNVKSDWNINFTTPLPNANYFWDYRGLPDPTQSPLFNAKVVQCQPYNSATYSDSVNTNYFRAYSTNIPEDGTSYTDPVVGRLYRMIFQAYTIG